MMLPSVVLKNFRGIPPDDLPLLRELYRSGVTPELLRECVAIWITYVQRVEWATDANAAAARAIHAALGVWPAEPAPRREDYTDAELCAGLEDAEFPVVLQGPHAGADALARRKTS